MKPIVIAPSDLADAFRLAGLPVFELEPTSDKVKQRVGEIIAAIRGMPDAGLVLVDERCMHEFETGLAGLELPMVASFPAEEVHHEEAYIDELTKRYLGQKIYVEGESA